MSIIKYTKDELPKERQVVYCDNEPHSSDRAIFTDGKFIGGGEYPVKEYEMTNVTKWFDFEEFDMKINSSCYSVSFEEAEKLE